MSIPSPQKVFSRVLPNGYITDVQWFRCNVLDVDQGAGIPPDGYYVTLFLDGVAEVFNQDIFVLPLDGFLPCRIIGVGGQTVSVVATFPWAADYDAIKMITTLTGQMIVKNRQQPQNVPLVQPQIRTQEG